MATYTTFRDLPIWSEAVDFAAEVYRFCENDNLKSDFRMRDQIRAAVASISNNIAEGFEYRNHKIFIRFLTYAKGSSGEVYNQFTILFKAGMIEQKDFEYFGNKALELGKKIGGFIQYLKSQIK